LWQINHGEVKSLTGVSRVVRACDRLRSMLSVYTVLCLMLILSSLGPIDLLSKVEWPTIRWLVFPLNHH
jgi:hypothetical protein